MYDDQCQDDKNHIYKHSFFVSESVNSLKTIAKPEEPPYKRFKEQNKPHESLEQISLPQRVHQEEDCNERDRDISEENGL